MRPAGWREVGDGEDGDGETPAGCGLPAGGDGGEGMGKRPQVGRLAIADGGSRSTPAGGEATSSLAGGGWRAGTCRLAKASGTQNGRRYAVPRLFGHFVPRWGREKGFGWHVMCGTVAFWPEWTLARVAWRATSLRRSRVRRARSPGISVRPAAQLLARSLRHSRLASCCLAVSVLPAPRCHPFSNPSNLASRPRLVPLAPRCHPLRIRQRPRPAPPAPRCRPFSHTPTSAPRPTRAPSRSRLVAHPFSHPPTRASRPRPVPHPVQPPDAPRSLLHLRMVVCESIDCARTLGIRRARLGAASEGQAVPLLHAQPERLP